MPKKVKAPSFPKTVGEVVDRLYELRQERLAAANVVSQCEDAEKALRKHCIEKFKKQDLDGARGKLAQVSISQPVVPVVEEWDDVYRWVATPIISTMSKMPDKQRLEVLEVVKQRCAIFQKRLSTEMWRDLLEAKTPVFGTKAFIATILHITALNGAKEKARGKVRATL